MFRLFEHFWLFWNFNRSQNPRFQTTATVHWWICSIFAYSSSQPCHPVCWIYASQSKLRTLFDLPIVQGCGSEQCQWPQGVCRGLYASDKYHLDWDQEWNISTRIILECRCTNRCCTPQGKNQQQWSEVKKCTAILELYGEANLNALSYTFTSGQTINYGPDMQKC